jgi:dipeptidyl aminopeptidase/acylaminoacyl peptidase
MLVASGFGCASTTSQSPPAAADRASSRASSEAADGELHTVAERSGFRATSRYADVESFCRRLATQSSTVHLDTLGETVEGRSIPLLVLADPPVDDPKDVGGDRMVVFAFGNIHAGEVAGKEALLMLAREIATTPDHPLLKDLVILLAPIYNADGNERVAKDNRPGQAGPDEGMGVRVNAQGFDLNRDYVKLESPEARALLRLYRRWNPAVVIDTHTTNGSRHAYTITYEGPRHPAGDPQLTTFVRDMMLPEVGAALEQRTGYRSFFYGNFDGEHTRWESYPVMPRYGTVYNGLCHRVAILCEAYAYASFEDRVLATREFVRECFAYAGARRGAFTTLLANARRGASEAPCGDDDGAEVAVRCEMGPAPKPAEVLGFATDSPRPGAEQAEEGAEPKSHTVEHHAIGLPARSVRRPCAYLLPGRYTAVAENLQRHGIDVQELREDLELDVSVYRVTNLERSERPFQEHRLVSVEVEARSEPRPIPAGSFIVPTSQPLGHLAVILLEPESEDGLCAWNFFDDALAVGADYPVLRAGNDIPLVTCAARTLVEDRPPQRPITYESVFGGDERADLDGSPVRGLRWLAHGNEYVHWRQEQPYRIAAETGRARPHFDPEEAAAALADLPDVGDRAARQAVSRPDVVRDPDDRGAVFEFKNDLYYATWEGETAVRLTNTPDAGERFVGFSPDGSKVSFIRAHDLHVVDVAGQAELRLTLDGGEELRNGEFDWVYAEELYTHGSPAHWWSPDSAYLAFLQSDETPVGRFTVIDEIPVRQDVERTPYPKAGDPNPRVRLGVVAASGGPIRWIDLDRYPDGVRLEPLYEGSPDEQPEVTQASSDGHDADDGTDGAVEGADDTVLVTRVGWTADGSGVWFCVMDRAQRWMDVNFVPREGGDAVRWLHETTGAWIDNPPPPEFLGDGSFILPSDRTGHRHLYRFTPGEETPLGLTGGEWDVQDIERVDGENGWVYFTGNRDNPIGADLFRVRVDGSSLMRLTDGTGTHRVSVSPNGAWYIDSSSDRATPTKVRLYDTEGRLARTIDSNPAYEREGWRLGQHELVEIPLPDGFVLNGSILLPPDFDPTLSYPVWFMTYAGPASPTVRDSWSRSRAYDEMLAGKGIIVFRCDPRSASALGARTTWTAYRQLGVPELADIEEAIAWLCRRPYVDPRRIGMSGHSYGGFMTAYAMTHSRLFRAGIAGAPVTDWRNYDTIYTERYMDTPQRNPEGYERTSVVAAAKNLHGRLLVLHGVMDDNVHFQNSLQLVQALQREGIQFEMMLYPRSRHGLWGAHYNRLTVDFIERNLGGPVSRTAGEDALAATPSGADADAGPR